MFIQMEATPSGELCSSYQGRVPKMGFTLLTLKALVNEDTLLPMMFLGLRKLGNICCGHKMFRNKIRNIFCVPDTKCVRSKCCARKQTGKHLCRQQFVSNNVSSFARALIERHFAFKDAQRWFYNAVDGAK